MSRISIPTVDAAPDGSKPLLAAVKRQLGVVPNNVAQTDIDFPKVSAKLAA